MKVKLHLRLTFTRTDVMGHSYEYLDVSRLANTEFKTSNFASFANLVKLRWLQDSTWKMQCCLLCKARAIPVLEVIYMRSHIYVYTIYLTRIGSFVVCPFGQNHAFWSSCFWLVFVVLMMLWVAFENPFQWFYSNHPRMYKRIWQIVQMIAIATNRFGVKDLSPNTLSLSKACT